MHSDDQKGYNLTQSEGSKLKVINISFEKHFTFTTEVQPMQRRYKPHADQIKVSGNANEYYDESNADSVCNADDSDLTTHLEDNEKDLVRKQMRMQGCTVATLGGGKRAVSSTQDDFNYS